MDKEKILEAAREANRGEEFETKMSVRGHLWGIVVSLIVGVGLFLFEYFKNGTRNTSIIAVLFTISGVSSLYEGIKTHRPVVIVSGCLSSIAAILMIYASIRQVLGI